jgi:hypothetical protein
VDVEVRFPAEGIDARACVNSWRLVEVGGLKLV